MAIEKPAVSAWRAGWAATKQAHHRIIFFYGIGVGMILIGGGVGTLMTPPGAIRLEKALYPAIGTVLGLLLGVLFLFLAFTVAAFLRQAIGSIITSIVTTQVSIQNNIAVISPYPTPIVMSNVDLGIDALSYLLRRGRQLENSVQNSELHETSLPQMELWLQRWLNSLQSDVWDYLPQQAKYILDDDGFVIDNEIQKYAGWNANLAARRVVLDRRLGRLREICSQIPELHAANTQIEEGEPE